MPSSRFRKPVEPPRHPFVGFPAGEPHYRAARMRAAVSCREYNDLPEDVSAEDRATAWNKITNNNHTHWMQSLESVTKTAYVGNPASNLSKELTSRRTITSASPAASRCSTSTAQHINDYPGYGKAPLVKGPIWVDYGIGLQIDGTTFVNRNCTFLDTPHTVIRIGKKCSVGPGCHFYGVTHPLDPDIRTDPQNPNTSIASNITIGDRCWIGGNVTVLPGVTIGDGCVVGAGSVVTKSLADYTLAYGVPARPRRMVPRSSRGEFDFRELERLSGGTAALAKHTAGWPPILEDLAETEQSHRRRHENAEWNIRMLVLFNAMLFAAVVWLVSRSALDASRGGGGHSSPSSSLS